MSQCMFVLNPHPAASAAPSCAAGRRRRRPRARASCRPSQRGAPPRPSPRPPRCSQPRKPVSKAREGVESKEAQTRGLVAPEVVLACEFILAVLLLLRVAEIILGARLLLLLVRVVVLVARLLLLAPAVRRCDTTQKRPSARCAKGRKVHRGLYSISPSMISKHAGGNVPKMASHPPSSQKASGSERAT